MTVLPPPSLSLPLPTDRPALIAANKMDLGEAAAEQLKQLRAHTKIPIIPICAADGRGVKRVTKARCFAVFLVWHCNH